MKIIFGTRSFKLKSYTLKELNLSEEDPYNIKIERRQKYFHLYWIPVLPTEKIWSIRKDGKLYDLPPRYKNILNKKRIKHRTPFYSFALPLILILGFSIYAIDDEVNSYLSNKKAQEEFNLELVDLNKKIANPMLNDFYEFSETGSLSTGIYIKIEAVTGDSILLHFLEIKLHGNYCNYIKELEEYFQDTPSSLNHAWVSRDELKKCIPNNSEVHDSFEGNYLPLSKDSINYRLIDIFSKERNLAD